MFLIYKESNEPKGVSIACIACHLMQNSLFHMILYTQRRIVDYPILYYKHFSEDSSHI